MRHHKSSKVDFHSDYPCPCRRHGRLLPIVLTDAFGCDRCQQIFVLQENGQVIEQLSSSYPYKRAWRWTGFRWVSARSAWGSPYFSVVSGMVALLLLAWLMLTLRYLSSLGMILGIAIAVLMFAFVATLFWIAYRRQ